jgi:hypothetical protein
VLLQHAIVSWEKTSSFLARESKTKSNNDCFYSSAVPSWAHIDVYDAKYTHMESFDNVNDKFEASNTLMPLGVIFIAARSPIGCCHKAFAHIRECEDGWDGVEMGEL